MEAHGGPKPEATDFTTYTTQELADWIGIKKNTLDKARSTGRGDFPPYIEVGRRRVYLHKDIVAWFEKNRRLNSGLPATG